jgi:hypothetical protein
MHWVLWVPTLIHDFSKSGDQRQEINNNNNDDDDDDDDNNNNNTFMPNFDVCVLMFVFCPIHFSEILPVFYMVPLPPPPPPLPPPADAFSPGNSNKI